MMRPSSFAVLALKFLQKSMMFTPCGPSAVPTGGAGVALPAEICNFTIACTFFAITFTSRGGAEARSFSAHTPSGRVISSPSPPITTRTPRLRVSAARSSDLFHLQEVEFHRRRPSENRHHHLQRALVRVHFVHHAIEAGER